MYTLLNWYLRNNPKFGISAGGNVINNTKFYSGENIHTSKIESVSIDNENKQFIFITYSGSNYIAKFEEINIERIEDIKSSFNQLNVSSDYLNICENAYKDAQYRLNTYIGDILNPSELYIKLAGTVFLKAFFMTSKRDIKEIPIKIHLGMFQDSTLITYSNEDFVDIRFWDTNYNTICPYNWNEELKAIKIYNIGDDITYEKGEVKIVLKHNELTEIKKDDVNIVK